MTNANDNSRRQLDDVSEAKRMRARLKVLCLIGLDCQLLSIAQKKVNVCDMSLCRVDSDQ